MNNDFIKFGQVTVIYNNKVTINYLLRYYLGITTSLMDETNIIVLFNDNNKMYELNKLPIEKITTNIKNNEKQIPGTMELNSMTLYKKNVNNETTKKNETNKIFGEIYDSRYTELTYMNSRYNCIYYIYDRSQNYNERIVFSLFKLKNSVDSCQFIFSYDNTKFTEIQICNIIRTILSSL